MDQDKMKPMVIFVDGRQCFEFFSVLWLCGLCDKNTSIDTWATSTTILLWMKTENLLLEVHMENGYWNKSLCSWFKLNVYPFTWPAVISKRCRRIVRQ